MKPSWSLPILLLIFFPSFSGASDFAGKVISVIDGDTFDVEHEQGVERVRLNGIDAPDKGQHFSQHAMKFIEEITTGQHLTIENKGQDKYEQTIGDVFLADGRHLNKELVKAGLAWWFCRYSADTELQQLEEDAREAKRGLWKDPAPTPPWIFRKLQRNQVPEASDFTCPPSASQPIPQNAGPSPGASDVIGNRRSHIYHRVDCPGYDKVSEGNRIAFVSVEAAEQAGYRVAGNCP
ncbi:MAG: thermonuclease family protein [Nitrospira sp.]